MTEAALQAGDAAIDGRTLHFLWWTFGACLIFVAALRVEAFKWPGGR